MQKILDFPEQDSITLSRFFRLIFPSDRSRFLVHEAREKYNPIALNAFKHETQLEFVSLRSFQKMQDKLIFTVDTMGSAPC